MSFDLMPWRKDHMFMTTTADTVTIRRATPDDGVALDRLAALDSSRALSGDVLVAEVAGAIAAAISLETRRYVADPFSSTAALIALLYARADLLTAPSSARLGARARRLLPAA